MKVRISVAAKALGVSQDTLRRWESLGKISVDRTAQGHRRLVQDVLEMITVFSARLYGARSRKNEKLLQALKQAADDV